MFQNLKITAAQTFILHTLFSLAIGGLGAGLMAAGQAALSKGLDLPMILGVGIAAFTASFMRGFVSLESNPQFAQAILDSVADVKQLIVNAQSVPAQPPVIIHNNIPPAPAAAPATPVTVAQPQPQFVPPMSRHFGDTGLVPTIPPAPPAQ